MAGSEETGLDAVNIAGRVYDGKKKNVTKRKLPLFIDEPMLANTVGISCICTRNCTCYVKTRIYSRTYLQAGNQALIALEM